MPSPVPVWAVVCALALGSLSDTPATQLTPLERLQESRLEAVHQARMRWSRTRVVQPPQGVYLDFRAILHVHAEDSPHTLGTRDQVLEAARASGVDAVLWTDHHGPKPDTWHGYRQGILFLPGAEDDHRLRYPGPDGDLQFLSHLEDLPDAPTAGFAGMEIYNRHTDANVQAGLLQYLQRAMKNAGEWKKLVARQKNFPDEVYAAGTGALPGFLARYDREIAKHPFTAIAANDAHRNTVLNGVLFDPYEVAFRFVSTHILARELTEEQIRQSLAEGHAYVAFDWLCDPSGFSFVASNPLGVFDMGDRVPLFAPTLLTARLPVPAHVKLIHNGAVVAETTAATFSFTPKEDGPYRLEAWLDVAGEERPWIYSNPLYLFQADAAGLGLLPPSVIDAGVKPLSGIPYAAGRAEDAGKHELDLYLPAGKTKFPVLFFVHGGGWTTGDRGTYRFLGNRFAKAGIGVVIPSYRLAPAHPPPSQIEDVAAAFAWTVQHIADYGGDPRRLFVAGHSAGGHLAALLALAPQYLEKYGLHPRTIQGVMALSGVYDVRGIAMFGPDRQTRQAASPIQYARLESPPFLVTYCQWDYPGLPAQARTFDHALRRAFAASTLLYIPGENHISEIAHAWKDGNPLAREILKFMETASN